MKQILATAFCVLALQLYSQSYSGLCLPQYGENYDLNYNIVKLDNGHFNSDSLSDLLIISSSNTVGVLLNPGNNIFDNTTIYSFAFNSTEIPVFIKSLHLNSDALSDFVVLTQSPSTYEVFINNNNGNFSRTVHSLPAPPISLIADDFNNDGNKDIVISLLNNTCNVYFGDGIGGFTFSQSLSISGIPVSVSSRDINNDTYQDILLINQNDITVKVFINNNSVFNSPISVATGTTKEHIAIIDYNHDSFMDVVLFGYIDTIAFYQGNGTGSLLLDTTIITNHAMERKKMFVSDMNNDGYEDIVFGVNGPGALILLSSPPPSAGFLPPIYINHSMTSSFGTIKEIDLISFAPNGVKSIILVESGIGAPSYILKSPAPPILSGPSEICEGQPLYLSISNQPALSIMGYQYNTSFSNTQTAITGLDSVFCTVTYLNSGNCVLTSANKYYMVKPSPSLPQIISNSPNNQYCVNDTAIAKISSPLTSYNNIFWNTLPSNIIYNGDSLVFLAIEGETSFSLFVDSAGCSAYHPYNIIVNPIPIVVPNVLNSSNTFCLSEYTNFFASQNFVTYYWINDFGGDTVSYSSHLNYGPLTSNDYQFTVYVVDTNGCIGNSSIYINMDSINLNVTPSGFVAYSNQNPHPGITYQWIDCFTNLPILGMNNQLFIASQSGQYAVIVSNGTCTDTSNCVSIVVASLQMHNESKIISIYPNPFTQTISVQLSENNRLERNEEYINIYNALGELVHKEMLTQNSFIEIQTSDLPKGLYFFNVKEQTIKIIKQ